MRAIRIGLALLSASFLSQPLAAADPRIATLDSAASGLLHLDTRPDTVAVVMFPKGERIVSVILSDPSAYSVGVAAEADSLSLRANGNRALAMMSVRTERRSYEFELASGAAASVPVVWQLVPAPSGQGDHTGSAGQAQSVTAPPDADLARYRLSGHRSVRPVEIRDDGKRTYIRWAERQILPATFSAGPGGKEESVDGYMRGGVFTIDRVFAELIFRIDKQTAVARRMAKDNDNEPG